MDNHMAYGQRTSLMENHAGKDTKKMVSITVHLPCGMRMVKKE